MPRNVDLKIDLTRLTQAIDSGAHDGLALGADLVAVEAKGLAPKRTSQLANSIQPEEPHGSLSSDDLETTVSAGAPYATFVEFGTGVYGPTGQAFFVQPKHAKALRFPVPGGGFAFSAGHWIQGARAQPYLTPAVEHNAERVAEQIAHAIESAIGAAFGG